MKRIAASPRVETVQYLGQTAIGRNAGEKTIAAVGTVYTAVMIHTVADHQRPGMKDEIVSRYLIEDFLTDGDRRSLVFDDHKRVQRAIVDDRVTPSQGAV